MVVSSCLCRASLQSGHYLKYFETKESRKADSALKGTIDVRQISKLSAGKDGAIAIIMGDGGKVHLKAPSEQSAALWMDALEGARTAGVEVAASTKKDDGSGNGSPENDAVLKATMTVAWLVIEGKDDDERQRRLMGRYELVPGKWVSGFGVWRDTEGKGRYLYFAGTSAEWCLTDREEDMQAGSEKGLAKVGGGSIPGEWASTALACPDS